MMIPVELGRAHPASALGPAFRRRERVAYTSNGNRITKPADVLARILPILPRCGITRVADISRMTHEEFPVFQACRPRIWGHHDLGQNTGGQGKGATVEQATISCLMESIETYCAEPRGMNLRRGSYAELRGHQIVIDPRTLTSRQAYGPVSEREPLMWTEAHSIELDETVLVPAECIFFPFAAAEHATQPHFPIWTNGLASGSTYLEAVTHALYEVIERYFAFLVENGDAAVFEIDAQANDLLPPLARKFLARTGDAIKTRIFLARRTHGEQRVTVAMCRMEPVFSGKLYDGSGCSSLPMVAIERALSEAAQAISVYASGAREDIVRPRVHAMPSASKSKEAQDSVEDYWPEAIRFTDLASELAFLVDEVHALGFPHVIVANLTREGIDVPVVKVLVPGMPVPLRASLKVEGEGTDTTARLRLQYGADRGH